MLNITFENNPKTKKFILELFNKAVDEEGYIIEKDSGNRILGFNGQEMRFADLGAIKNGSEIYVKGDIVSLVDFYSKFLSAKTHEA